MRPGRWGSLAEVVASIPDGAWLATGGFMLGRRTNMTSSGGLERPRSKFPGVAGVATLRQWVRRPVLVAITRDERPSSLGDPG